MSTLSPTLSRAIEGFILHKTASGLSPNTIRNYKNQLKRFKEWANNSPIDEITPQHIEEFFQYLREGFQITRVCDNVSVPPRKLSAKTIKNAWGCLSTFWKWASREFQLDNPFTIPQPKAHTKPVHPLSMDEVESLLKACDFSAR
jgi:site-specific recombinase XerD